MVRVLTEFGAGHIREAYIDDDDSNYVHGTEEAGHIVINPAPAIVDTLIHEILHRLYPAWPERVVAQKTSWLMNRMSHQEVKAIYREYVQRYTRRGPA